MSSQIIAVIGAGVVGASVAYHLAKRGTRVILIDKGERSASGVTRHAFGWINLINGTPTHKQSYNLLQRGVEEIQRLRTELPAAFRTARNGSILWKNDVDATVNLVYAHRDAGTPIELIDREAIAEFEPQLRQVPIAAAYSPADLAIEPAHLTESLVRAAVEAGAETLFGTDVVAIEAANGRISAIRTGNGLLPVDGVVLAAGGAAESLTRSLGIEIGLEVSPSVLLRYAAERRFVNRIVRGPGLEIRQAADNSIVVAKGFDPDADMDALGARTLDVIQNYFDDTGPIRLLSTAIGQRPMFADGLPRLGFLPQVGGLYLAVGHPGIILSALMGRQAAEEIVSADAPAH